MKKTVLFLSLFIGLNAASPKAMQTQCDKHQDPKSCFELGLLYIKGDEITQDHALAIEYFSKACKLKYGIGCNNIGMMYAYGDGVEQSYAKAKEFYKKACKLGSGAGCTNFGIMSNKRGKPWLQR